MQWRMINLLGAKIFTNIALREHNYKSQHRWYWTFEQMSKMSLDATVMCWSCNSYITSYCHVWWDCRMIVNFWILVAEEVDKIMGTSVPFTPRVYLLHDFSWIKV